MSILDFLCPRLVGERFENHAIPLEFLGDLAVLEPMIIEVAKWRYLQDRPNRQRSPRKFTEGISLTLTSVNEGSAIATIALSFAMGNFPPPYERQFLEARDAIVRAIGAAAENRSPVDYVPQKSLAYFDRLGRSLQSGEAIEFSNGTSNPPVRLTKETRLRLLRAAALTERSEEIHLRGVIHDLDHHAMTFKIMLSDGSKIPGPINDSDAYETLNEASYRYRHGVKVQIDGIGKYDRSDRLQKIESVERVTLLDPLDVSSQLEELKSLKNGWYDGKGLAPSAVGLEWLARTFDVCYADDLNLPYVYPVAEGGVRFEWSIARRDISLEIDLNSHLGAWHSLELDTDEETVKQLNLDAQSDWDWMSPHLRDDTENEA